MGNFIVSAILILIVAAIVCYLIRLKKRGSTCVGCPYAKQCGVNCSGGCNHKEKGGE